MLNGSRRYRNAYSRHLYVYGIAFLVDIFVNFCKYNRVCQFFVILSAVYTHYAQYRGIIPFHFKRSDFRSLVLLQQYLYFLRQSVICIIGFSVINYFIVRNVFAFSDKSDKRLYHKIVQSVHIVVGIVFVNKHFVAVIESFRRYFIVFRIYNIEKHCLVDSDCNRKFLSEVALSHVSVDNKLSAAGGIFYRGSRIFIYGYSGNSYRFVTASVLYKCCIRTVRRVKAVKVYRLVNISRKFGYIPYNLVPETVNGSVSENHGDDFS